MTKWWLIRNPVAGSGRAEKDWPKIESALQKEGVLYTAVVSSSYEHAMTLAAEGYASGFRHFIVIGGDGSVNEVINGIVEHKPERLQEITLALLPVGKGNDWRKSLQLPTAYSAAASAIAAAHTLQQDVGTVTYQGPTGELQYRLFVNMAGIGFDGAVTKSVNEAARQGKRMSRLSYLWQLIHVLFKHEAQRARYSGPNDTKEADLFSVAIGKGQYNGGGMRQAPHAELADGYLAITLIRSIPVWEVIVNVGRLFSGSFVRHRKVDTWKAPTFSITSPGLLLETDGESLGKTPATFQLLPRYLRVIVPKK